MTEAFDEMVSGIKGLASPLQDLILREAITDREYANKAAAEYEALKNRVKEFEAERRFIDGIVMGDGNHDKVILAKDAMIFMQCMKILGLDVSGYGPESIVDAIIALKGDK